MLITLIRVGDKQRSTGESRVADHGIHSQDQG